MATNENQSAVIARCCFIGCDKLASWEIWDSPGSCGDTLACSDHVGHLLSDAPEHRVYPYRQPAAQEGVYRMTAEQAHHALTGGR